MAFGDLIRRRRLVDSGGRRYVCRPPSLATVFLALQRYGVHVEIARKTWALSPGDVPTTAVQASETLVAILLAEPEHLPEILATCVEPAPPLAACRAALAGVLDLVDVLRIGESIARDLARPKGAGESIEDAPTRLAIQVARRFRLSPLEIANDWPYEAVLSVQDSAGPGKDKVMKPTPFSLAPGTGGARVKKRPLPN